jgi:hypothetical protein
VRGGRRLVSPDSPAGQPATPTTLAESQPEAAAPLVALDRRATPQQGEATSAADPRSARTPPAGPGQMWPQAAAQREWAASPEQPLVAREQPAPPTIHVSIGRIEVRAVTAPAPQQQRPAAPAPPKLSLDEYLRAQNGAKR